MNETGGRSTKNWDIPNHQVFHDQQVTWRTFCAHVLEWKWIQSICNSTCLSKWSIVWRSGKIFGGWKWDRSIQRTPRIHAASLAIAKNKYIRSVRASNWGPIHQKTSENHFGIHFDKTCSAFFNGMIRLIQWKKRAWNIWKPKYAATLWSRGHLCPPLSFDTKEPTFWVSIFHDFPSKQSAVFWPSNPPGLPGIVARMRSWGNHKPPIEPTDTNNHSWLEAY